MEGKLSFVDVLSSVVSAGPKLLWDFTPLYVTRQQKEVGMSRLFLYDIHVT